jgi:hypothetical protein
MSFEEYLITVVRNRPQELKWQESICHGVMGLAGHTANLVTLVQSGRVAFDAPSRLTEALSQIEAYRALAYYQLDVRPSAPASFLPRGATTPAGAAISMLVESGHLVHLINAWLHGRRTLPSQRLAVALERFDAARGMLYEALGTSPESLWGGEAARFALAS